MGDTKLLPCPFCGGQPKVGETNSCVPGMEDCGYAYVECCVVHVHSSESVEETIAIWNRRHGPALLARQEGEDGPFLTQLDRLKACVYVGHPFDACARQAAELLAEIDGIAVRSGGGG